MGSHPLGGIILKKLLYPDHVCNSLDSINPNLKLQLIKVLNLNFLNFVHLIL